MILFDLSSRAWSPISVHSQVFPWIVEHTTDILNKCHVASDGKSAYEPLKRRGGLGKRFHTEEDIVAREGDGLVIR